MRKETLTEKKRGEKKNLLKKREMRKKPSEKEGERKNLQKKKERKKQTY